jgi:hypothetical protein
VQPGLRGQEGDGVARHVGHVRGEDVDAAAQRPGQRVEQVSDMEVCPRQVPPGAADRGGVDVGGMQVGDVQDGGQCRTHRPGAAAEVHDDGPGRREGDRLAHQQLRAPAGHEHSRLDGDPQPAELRPAQEVLQGEARDPLLDQRGEGAGGARRVRQEARLVLGEDAPGGAQPGHDGGVDGRVGHGAATVPAGWAAGGGRRPRVEA